MIHHQIKVVVHLDLPRAHQALTQDLDRVLIDLVRKISILLIIAEKEIVRRRKKSD